MAAAHIAAGPAPALDPAGLDERQRGARRKLLETIAKVGDEVVELDEQLVQLDAYATRHPPAPTWLFV